MYPLKQLKLRDLLIPCAIERVEQLDLLFTLVGNIMIQSIGENNLAVSYKAAKNTLTNN